MDVMEFEESWITAVDPVDARNVYFLSNCHDGRVKSGIKAKFIHTLTGLDGCKYYSCSKHCKAVYDEEGNKYMKIHVNFEFDEHPDKLNYLGPIIQVSGSSCAFCQTKHPRDSFSNIRNIFEDGFSTEYGNMIPEMAVLM